MTWVVADFTATPGTNEVSVVKGQQVEILDNGSAVSAAMSTTSSTTVTTLSTGGDFCLVRLSPMGGADGGGTQEGLVPIGVLKPAPGKGGASNAASKDHHHHHVDIAGKWFHFHRF